METDSNWVDREQTQTLGNSADAAASVARTLEYTKEICKDFEQVPTVLEQNQY